MLAPQSPSQQQRERCKPAYVPGSLPNAEKKIHLVDLLEITNRQNPQYAFVEACLTILCVLRAS